MVRKVSIMMACFALVLALGNRAQASDYTVYDGNMSSTYIDYFRDIVAGIGFNEHYVAFRSGQYEYTLIVGELIYADGNFSLVDTGTCYTISNSGNYNSLYEYDVSRLEQFSLSSGNYIVYSDLGQFPRLTTRGENYEILQTYTLCAIGLFVLFVRIFGKR